MNVVRRNIDRIPIEVKATCLITLLTFARFIRVAPTTIGSYIAEQYLISYKYGFIARGFMGTLLSGFPYLPLGALYLIGLLVEFVMTIIFLWFIYKGLCMVQENKKVYIACFAIIFAASPMAPAFTYAIHNFGRFDAILIGIAMLQAFLLLKPSLKKGILVCALSFIAILIHPIYVFSYFIVSELILLYVFAKENKKNTWLILFLTNTIIVCGMFLLFEYVRMVGPEWTQESMYNDMQARTNFDLGENFYGYLNDWYFGTVDSQMTNTVRPFEHQPLLLFMTICFMLPYEIVCIRAWWKGLKESSNHKIKFFFLCAILAFVATIPAFAIQIDYGRWCASYYLSQGVVFLYLLFVEDQYVHEICVDIMVWSKNNVLLAFSCLIYCVTLGWFKDISMIELTGNGYTFFKNLYELITGIIIG